MTKSCDLEARPAMEARRGPRAVFAASRRRFAALAGQEGLSPGWRFFLYLLTAIAFFTRCPSMFTRAQFYAEDGFRWYQQAYNDGWLHSLLVPSAGYLNAVPRLGTGLALLVPLSHAPLVMALLGLAVQSLPVAILLGARCRSWGSLPLRILFAVIYVALPNAREVHVVLTNAQWHLGLVLLLLAFSDPPRTAAGRITEGVIFLLTAFSGPFGAVLLPLVLLYWWVRRQRWTLVLTAILASGAVVQGVVVMQSAQRSEGPLGASPGLLVRMVGGHIVAGALFNGHVAFGRAPLAVLVPAAGLALLIWSYCLRMARLPLRLMTAYCLLLLAVSLYTPQISGPRPRWELLISYSQGRYWYYPMLALLWGAAWCALEARSRAVAVISRAMLCLLPIGVAVGWEYRPYADQNYHASVERFEAAPPGTRVVIPIPPEHAMVLIKRAAR